MTLEPFVNQVVVKQITVDKTQSGIILPDDSDKENKIGEIVAIAESYFDSGVPFKFPFNVGDKVIFVTYSSPVLDPEDSSNKFYILAYNEVKAKQIN
jgi:co-chaperonin GroES (HSP10)